jgi:gamma-glutamylcysteine synthetase
MGQSVDKINFDTYDFQEFSRKLELETLLLQKWKEAGLLSQGEEQQSGFELELWLLNKDYHPASNNCAFADEVNNQFLICEVANSALEVNLPVETLHEDILTKHHERLNFLMNTYQNYAEKCKQYLVAVGTLPTAKPEDYTESTLTEQMRFQAMRNFYSMTRSRNAPRIAISGNEMLDLLIDNITLIGAMCSFQIHFRTNLAQLTRLYNASLIMSAPLVALAANSPFILGKNVWDESRIPYYEQVMAANNPYERMSRVTFGEGYIYSSLEDLLIENHKNYSPVLPQVLDTATESMFHLRLHNGTIYRWNRPVLDFDHKGNPFLRLEFRPLSAGPSAVDMIANAAFYYGVVYQAIFAKTPLEELISFHSARKNFYNAAKQGLSANIEWCNGEKINIKTLVLERLLPQAKEGLKRLDINENSILYYLSIIEDRIKKNQNGSQWQKEFYRKNSRNFEILMAGYLEMQRSGKPVHEWPTE